MFDEDRDVNATKKLLADWIFNDKIIQFNEDNCPVPVLFAQENSDGDVPVLPEYAVRYLYYLIQDFGLSFTHLAAPVSLTKSIKRINPKLNLCEFEIQKSRELIKLRGNDLGKGGEAIIFTTFFTGQMEMKVVKLLRSAGFKVKKIVCLINTAPGNGELIRELNCEVLSRFYIRKLIHYYYQENKISTEQHRNSILMFVGADVLGEDY